MSGDKKEVFIGKSSDITDGHQALKVNGRSLHLLDEEGELTLYSSRCPHMGGEVGHQGDKFRCPLHGWEFKKENGECINVEGESLEQYPVWEEGGKVFAQIPPDRKTHGRESGSVSRKDVNIKLHSHACMEIECGSFSLLTDPWLKGNAFMGAWELFPPPVTKPDDINPDAIWISHEHSDHFHIETLKEFSRDIPVYFPDFPNDRIRQILIGEGFEDVNPMPFGEPFGLEDEVKIMCFEPKSMWNDSIVLIECGGRSILNLNDAGLNDNVAETVAPVDMVASAYTWGASGYPLTWSHLDEKEKTNIIEESNEGMLAMLRQAADLYGADYVLPFAAHWVLWHPDHREYLQKMEKNSLKDVVDEFDNSEVEVVDIYPGESWNFDKNDFSRLWGNRERLRNEKYIKNYAKNKYDEERFWKYHTNNKSVSKKEVKQYILELNSVPNIKFCKDISAFLECGEEKGKTKFKVKFKINNGFISIKEKLDSKDIKIRIPEDVLGDLVRKNLSWDEAHIGYWCNLHRSPDEYHFNFWRLLQAPYYERGIKPHSSDGGVHADRSISGILEDYGTVADRILRRYGLYCMGCQYSSQETVRDGARAHGLSEDKTQRLVEELNQVLHGRR